MEPREVERLLSTLSLFQELPSQLVADLARQTRLTTFPQGTQISEEGISDPNSYVVVSGSIRITKRVSSGEQSILRYAQSGEILGLTSMFFTGGRSASMVAETDCTVIVIPHALLHGYLRKTDDPGALLFTQGLLKELAKRLRKKNARLAVESTQEQRQSVGVLVFDAKPYVQDLFTKLSPSNLSFSYLSERLNPVTARLAEGYGIINLFVNDSVTAETARVLREGGVECITLRCAGFNNVDLAACQELGISVLRVPAYSPYAVAEHALALLMTLNRKIHKAYDRVRNGDFRLDGLVGMDLHGKTVGVIGTGKIGVCFINIMRGLGCRVLAYDVVENPALQGMPEVTYTSLSHLYRESDVISLHAPLTKDTHHLIDDAALSQMKSKVLLINTSRGALIDARALIEALKNKSIGGAGLDVYEEEEGYFFEDLSSQVIKDDTLARLFTFNNVIVTGHQAFLTNEALENITTTTIQNIQEYLEGKRGEHLTNRVK